MAPMADDLRDQITDAIRAADDAWAEGRDGDGGESLTLAEADAVMDRVVGPFLAAVRETADALIAMADQRAAADPYGLTADEALLRHAVARFRAAIGDVAEAPEEPTLRVRGW